MESINYPELDAHKKVHQDIILSMNIFTKNLTKMSLNEIEKELAHFIEIWFINHIIYVDKKIAQWQLTHQIPDFTFRWKDAYSIKNATIDAEHQELFIIASEAFKKAPKDQKLNKIKTTLSKLYQYFNKHFEDEEKYMLEIKYDKLDNHKKEHQNIIQDLNDFIKNISTMTIESIEDNLKKFIENSLVKHILEDDMKILFWNKYIADLKDSKELRQM